MFHIRKKRTRHTCPVCGAQNPDQLVLDLYGTVIGCDCCMDLVNADAYFEEKEESDRERLRG